MKVRLLDLGTVPYLHSQTIWHAVAYAMDESSPDTITLMSPDVPYVCIGYHQELEKEIDVDFCQRQGLPMTRREVGGGAVYLDNNQVFTHFVFHRDRAPGQVEEFYRHFVRPLVETYRALGIEAYHRPINDIQVGGRKIGGTGAALIEDAMVMASSLMFDFDTRMMSLALKVPSEKMRDKVYQGLEEYMTTLRRELGSMPSREAVKELFARKCEETLGIELVQGELTPKEREIVEELNRRFVLPDWLNLKTSLPKYGVKIKEGVHVLEAAYKARGGLIRATTLLEESRIEDLTLSGDFTMVPSRELGRLEKMVEGARMEEEPLQERVDHFYHTGDVQSPGVETADWVKAILSASTPS